MADPSESDSRITQFQETAKAYCALIERWDGSDRRAFLERCLELLSTLFAQAVHLPDVGTLDRTPAPAAEFGELGQSLQAKLGAHDAHWLVFQPFHATPPEASRASMGYHLAEIWEDLSKGLRLARQGSLADAAYAWRFGFYYHWGPNHAAHLFRPMLELLYGANSIDDQDSDPPG